MPTSPADSSPNRACHDDRCEVRATCRLWTAREAPGFAVRCLTWRKHYECHSLPCDYWQAAEAPHA